MQIDKQELARILDITDPFLMIDHAPEVVPGKFAHAQSQVLPDAWFMQCHLTKAPVMPGVLQAEVMLQTFALPVLLDTGHIGQQSFLKHFEVALQKKVERRYTPFVLEATATIAEARRGVYKGTAELHMEGTLMARIKVTMVSPHAMLLPRAGLKPLT
jgi:3-hydroxymyristoyl/3-hydroxydecanoyl-(acyl carrier protein) dehydratase